MFQSTHPHGVRPFIVAEPFEVIEFQSTHPHGVRHPVCKLLNLSIFDLKYRENTKNQ